MTSSSDITPAPGADEGKPMSRQEAGRLGGQTTRQRYGDDFYRQIGRKGGRKGGETTRDRHGREHYERIGRIGGKTPARDLPPGRTRTDTPTFGSAPTEQQ